MKALIQDRVYSNRFTDIVMLNDSFCCLTAEVNPLMKSICTQKEHVEFRYTSALLKDVTDAVLSVRWDDGI